MFWRKKAAILDFSRKGEGDDGRFDPFLRYRQQPRTIGDFLSSVRLAQKVKASAFPRFSLSENTDRTAEKEKKKQNDRRVLDSPVEDPRPPRNRANRKKERRLILYPDKEKERTP